MLGLDLRYLRLGVLVDKLESILVLTSQKLILLVGNSILVGLEVGIRGILSSSGGIKISSFPVENVGLLNMVIKSLELGVKGSILSTNGGGSSIFLTWESSFLVVSEFEFVISLSSFLKGSGVSTSG